MITGVVVMGRFWFVVLSLALFAICSHADSGSGGPHLPPPLDPVPIQPTGVRDPLLDQAWHLNHLNAYEVWKTTKGNPEILIAIVDSGIEYNHPDLAGNNPSESTKEWPFAETVRTKMETDSSMMLSDLILFGREKLHL